MRPVGFRFGFGRFYAPRGHRLDAERIYLRPPRYRDWRAWAELRESSRAFLTPWEPDWPTDALGHAAYRRRLRQVALEWHTDAGYAFHILRRADDTLLGGVTLSNVHRGIAQSASLGYWVGRPHARRGHMAEALRCLLPFAFERLGLHRIEAACLPHNEASRRLLLQVGFTPEGQARDYLRIAGVWQDHLLFGLIKGDLERRERPARTSIQA